MRPSAEGDAHDLLVCHANVIRWYVTRALQATFFDVVTGREPKYERWLHYV